MSKRKSKKDENLSESDQDSDSESDKSDANDKKTSKLKKKHKRRHETSSDSDTDSDSDSSSDSDDDGGHRKRSKNKKHKKTKKSKKHKKQREEHKPSSIKKDVQPPAPVSASSDEGGGGGGGGDRQRYNKKPPPRDDKKYMTAPIVHVDENWDNCDDGGDPPPPPPESKQPRSMSSDRVKHDDSKWDRSPEQRRVDERPKFAPRPFNRDYREPPRDQRRSRSNEMRRRPDYEHRDDRGGGGDRGGGRFSNFNRRDDFNHRGGGRGGRGGWGNRGFQDRGGGGGGRFNNHYNDGDRRQDNWQNKPFENRRFQHDRFQNDRFQNDRYQNDRYPNKDQHHPGDRDRRDFNKPDRRDDYRRQRNDDRDGRNNDRGERDFREPRNNDRNHSYQRDDQDRDRKPFRRFKQEKDDGDYEWGGGDRKQSRSSPSQERRSKRGSRERSVEKERPNFGLSGKLTEDTNKVNGVVIKYAEPPEARKPKRRWRLYPFKGEETLPTMYIHRQSCYLIGRDRKVCDLPVDHPSCSKQHAVLQYRLVPFTRDDGSMGKRVRPYIIDLESANGTFLNNKKIEPKKYIEIMEKDVLKFGFSSREYVMLHENSKEDQEDDDVAVD